MAESFADANGLKLCYEIIGDRADPALVLIGGLNSQLIRWPDSFCADLAARGFCVIRFDNRDSGRRWAA